MLPSSSLTDPDVQTDVSLKAYGTAPSMTPDFRDGKSGAQFSLNMRAFTARLQRPAVPPFFALIAILRHRRIAGRCVQGRILSVRFRTNSYMLL